MKIALIGYGKMGKEIERIPLNRGHEIVCIRSQQSAGLWIGGFPLCRCCGLSLPTHGGLFKLHESIYRRCESGFRKYRLDGWARRRDQATLQHRRKTLFWASNFSLGVVIFSAVNKHLAKIMNQFPAYDVTMSETHHIHKLDARVAQPLPWLRACLKTWIVKVTG